MDWVKQILPTIGNLLGGPLGGAAVSAVAGVLGISESTQEKIQKALSSGQLTAEQMAALQAAGGEHQRCFDPVAVAVAVSASDDPSVQRGDERAACRHSLQNRADQDR